MGAVWGGRPFFRCDNGQFVYRSSDGSLVNPKGDFLTAAAAGASTGTMDSAVHCSSPGVPAMTVHTQDAAPFDINACGGPGQMACPPVMPPVVQPLPPTVVFTPVVTPTPSPVVVTPAPAVVPYVPPNAVAAAPTAVTASASVPASAVVSTSFLTDSMFGGIPNWALLAGAAGAFLLFRGK